MSTAEIFSSDDETAPDARGLSTVTGTERDPAADGDRPVRGADGGGFPTPISRSDAAVDHLSLLESHAIFVLREVAAESERPVLLFSGGKDSAVLLHLAVKAFRPARFPFPIMHIDTGHNFPEVIAYRDARVAEL